MLHAIQSTGLDVALVHVLRRHFVRGRTVHDVAHRITRLHETVARVDVGYRLADIDLEPTHFLPIANSSITNSTRRAIPVRVTAGALARHASRLSCPATTAFLRRVDRVARNSIGADIERADVVVDGFVIVVDGFDDVPSRIALLVLAVPRGRRRIDRRAHRLEVLDARTIDTRNSAAWTTRVALFDDSAATRTATATAAATAADSDSSFPTAATHTRRRTHPGCRAGGFSVIRTGRDKQTRAQTTECNPSEFMHEGIVTGLHADCQLMALHCAW